MRESKWDRCVYEKVFLCKREGPSERERVSGIDVCMRKCSYERESKSKWDRCERERERERDRERERSRV